MYIRKAIVGVDVGGANLKVATEDGIAGSRVFPLWKTPDSLALALLDLMRDCGIEGRQVQLALTMTGEMADCFGTRREGVAAILRQVLEVVPLEQVFVYRVDGEWCNVEAAWEDPWGVAASNWRALADWVVSPDGPFDPVPDLLVDVGSTTTDVIPLAGGAVATNARTDRDRMQRGQLVYVGCQRTPLAAIAHAVMLDGKQCPLMAEHFADMGDVLLLAGLTPESASEDATADGRPRTRTFAAARLARMVGEDAETLGMDDAVEVAAQILQSAVGRIVDAICRQFDVQTGSPRERTLLCTGHGEGLQRAVVAELARRNQAFRSLWLGDVLSSSVSRAAPAYACARLLRFRCHSGGMPVGRAGEHRSSVEPVGQHPSVQVAPSRCRSDAGGGSETLPRRVVKLGGSLLDLPDLPQRLRQWLRNQPPARNLVVVGGGGVVDAIRRLDRAHALPPAEIHWMCVRLLDCTWELSRFLFPEFSPLDDRAAVDRFLASSCVDRVGLVRVQAFYRPDAAAERLPVGWNTTSDSLAALLAEMVEAPEVVLLKSTTLEDEASDASGADAAVRRWADAGLVDGAFPAAARCIRRVRYINLRSVAATPQATSAQGGERAFVRREGG